MLIISFCTATLIDITSDINLDIVNAIDEANVHISNVLMSNSIELTIKPSITSNASLSNVPMSDIIDVHIQPSMTSEIPIPITNIIASPIIPKQSRGSGGPYNKKTKPTSIDVNGFDIYLMQRTNIIRVHDVSSLCRHSICDCHAQSGTQRRFNK